MEPLTIVAWHWGDKYGPEYIDRLRRGLERSIKQPYRFLVETPIGDPLTARPGCLVRLKMFDPAWQAARRIEGRLVCIDLDVVITGELDTTFDRKETFLILQGANASNPCPYNGSLFMVRTGHHRSVWDDFSLEAVAKIPFHEFPDDQAWLAHKLPGQQGWPAGWGSGIWSFRKRGWPASDILPIGARLVVFPGRNDPGQHTHLKFISKHWLQ